MEPFGTRNSPVPLGALDTMRAEIEALVASGADLTQVQQSIAAAMLLKSARTHTHTGVVGQEPNVEVSWLSPAALAFIKTFSDTSGTRDGSAITVANSAGQTVTLTQAIADIYSRFTAQPPTQPTQTAALTLSDTTPDVNQTVTITPPTWSAAVTNVVFDILILGITTTQSGVTFIPPPAWSSFTGSVTARGEAGGLPVLGTAVAFTVNAATATFWTATTVFSTTKDIKALTLNGAGTQLSIAESIITTGGGGVPVLPTFVAASTTRTTAGTPALLPIPAGTAADDLVLVYAAGNYSSDVGYIPHTGFGTPIAEGVNAGNGLHYAAWAKVESGTPSGDYTWAWTAETNCALMALTYRGQHASYLDFVANVGSIISRASPVTIPGAPDTQLSGTTSFANTLKVLLASGDWDGVGDPTSFATAGWTERVDYIDDAHDPLTAADLAQAVAGATGNVTTVLTASGGATYAYGAVLLGIRGALGGGTGEVSDGTVAISARSGSTWAAKSVIYSGDGLVAAADEQWVTGLANTSDGLKWLIGLASNGYAGPGHGLMLDSVEGLIQAWVSDFDAPGGSAWPDDIACNDDGTAMVVVVRGSINAVVTMDVSAAGGFVIGQAFPVLANVPITPGTSGTRISMSGDGLAFVVVNGAVVSTYTRASKGTTAPWSFGSSVTPRGAGLMSVAMSRNKNRLAIGRTAGVDTYSGSYNAWTFDELLTSAGGTEYGRCLAFNDAGTMLVASKRTATAATGTTRSEKQCEVLTYTRA